jgi:acyl-CoA thioester hydrolase
MNEELKLFRHAIPVQLRFSDIDRLDHVNNACYHNYCELGRVTYFEQVLEGAVNWDKQGFILARTEIDHEEPLFLNDEVRCYTRVSRIGNKSVTFRNLITKKKGNEEIVSASVTGILVAMDYETSESIPVPERWREKFRAFEGKPLT